jgi:hypothetical protein
MRAGRGSLLHLWASLTRPETAARLCADAGTLRFLFPSESEGLYNAFTPRGNWTWIWTA